MMIIVFLQALRDTTKDIDVQKKIDAYLLKINNHLKLNAKGPFIKKDAKVFINMQNENLSELDKKSKIYAMYSLYTCKLAILDIADNTILKILNKFSYFNMYEELDCSEMYSA